jgi:hypothetical protein
LRSADGQLDLQPAELLSRPDPRRGFRLSGREGAGVRAGLLKAPSRVFVSLCRLAGHTQIAAIKIGTKTPLSAGLAIRSGVIERLGDDGEVAAGHCLHATPADADRQAAPCRRRVCSRAVRLSDRLTWPMLARMPRLVFLRGTPVAAAAALVLFAPAASSLILGLVASDVLADPPRSVETSTLAAHVAGLVTG